MYILLNSIKIYKATSDLIIQSPFTLHFFTAAITYAFLWGCVITTDSIFWWFTISVNDNLQICYLTYQLHLYKQHKYPIYSITFSFLYRQLMFQFNIMICLTLTSGLCFVSSANYTAVPPCHPLSATKCSSSFIQPAVVKSILPFLSYFL